MGTRGDRIYVSADSAAGTQNIHEEVLHSTCLGSMIMMRSMQKQVVF